MIENDPQLQSVLVLIGDGMTVSKVKKKLLSYKSGMFMSCF
ncbi:hypothetical protein [Bacillus cereus]|nr:hypothetical protein [Bacillus cereus]